MNTIIFIMSTIIIIASHLFAISLFPTTQEVIVSKPQYQKISLQFARIEPMKPQVKKEEIIKKVIEKEVFIKPIKKNAQKQLQKKNKIVKKVQKKKMVKKVIEKKLVQKKVLKAPAKKVKKSSPKETAQSVKEYKIFKNDYINKLRSAIDKNKKYPRISRKLKEQGEVTISFRVLKNGKFANVRILKMSHKKRLNNAALNAVLLTKSFDAFPKKLSQKEFMDIALPINFKLL